MKILFLSNVFPPQVLGGYELGCLSIAEACRRAGHDVTVVTSYPAGTLATCDVAHRLRVLRLFAPAHDLIGEGWDHRHSAAREGLGGIVPANCLALDNALRAEKPDALWCFNPLGLGPVGIFEVAAMSGVPTVVHLMDHLDAMVGISQNGFHLTGRWAEAKRRLAAISCSQATLESNSTIGEYRTTAVIPNGINVDEPMHDRRRFRRIEAGVPVRLVYFGQIIPEKGVSCLVPAVRRLRRLLARPVELHLVGRCPGDYESTLRAWIRSDGIEDAVVWHGLLDPAGVDRVLAEMHVAVLPLRIDEPFGYVGLEAVAWRLPIVAGARAGFTSLLPPGYPFLIDDPTSADEIVAAVAGVCRDQEACERWVDAACAHVRECGDLERAILPRYIAFLEQVRAEAATAPAVRGDVGSLIASWQMNRNLSRLIPEAAAAPAVAEERPAAWRRYGRKLRSGLRDMLPETWRLELRKIATRVRGGTRRP